MSKNIHFSITMKGKDIMSLLSRFATSAALAAVPFLYSGCEKDPDPLPMDQEITGIATKVDYYCPYGRELQNITVYFQSDDGKTYNLGLVIADRSDKQDYEADVVISSDNFLTAQSIKANKFDQRIETWNNQEYSITVNIVPGRELTVGHDDNMGGFKSFEILVPSNAKSIINYSFGNESKIREMFNDSEKLSEAIQYILSNVENDPYEQGSRTGFAADLKLD